MTDDDMALVPHEDDGAGGVTGSHHLNHREFRLVEEYLKGKPPIQAAVAAGYSPTTARVKAHNMLKRPHIRAEIQRRTTEATGITPDYIMHSVHDLAMGAKSEQVRLGAWKLLGQHHGLWERGATKRTVPINIHFHRKEEVIEVDGREVDEDSVSPG
jgi:phage terminase small subunit